MNETVTPSGIVNKYGQPIGQENTVPILDAHGNQMPVAEGTTPGQTETTDPVQPENVATEPEAEKTESGTSAETAETPPTEEEKTAEASARKSEITASNANLVLDWMMDKSGTEMDPQIFELFKKAMEEQDGVIQEKLDQTAELITKLSEIFKKFDQAVEKLKDNPEFKDIESKQIEIKKAICLSVINGHLTASDIPQLVTGVTIEAIPVKEPPPTEEQLANMSERDRKIRKMMDTCGYDSVAYWDRDTGEIVVFDSTLKDNAKTQDGRPIGYAHLINHEMSHAFTERYLTENKELIGLCDIIVENRTEVSPFLTEHIQNTLASMDKIEEDFPKAEKTMPGLTKEQFIEMRKLTIAKEIITDFSAIYLQTDGTAPAFMEKCALSAGTNFENMPEIAKKTYEIFYKKIKSELEKNKGKVSSHKDFLEKHGEQDEDNWGYYEPTESFAQASPQGKGGGESIWRNVLGLMEAMAGEAPDLAGIVGKQA
jgi:hypothetical protein